MMEFEILDKFCGSTFWNSSLTWYTEEPDFTKCFEETVLVWTPCLFLWLFVPMEIYYIRSSKRKSIPWNWLNCMKLFCIGLLCAIALSASLSKLAFYDDNLEYVDIYTPLLKLLTFICIGLLVYYNKKNGLQTSGVLFLFWFLLAICGAAQFRSEILHTIRNGLSKDYIFVSYMMYYFLVVLMLLLNAFSDKPCQISKQNKYKEQNAEIGASFVSRLTFAWFDNLMLKGFRKPLVFDDLCNLKPEDTSAEIIPKFEKKWSKTWKNYERYSQNESKYKSADDNRAKKLQRVSIVSVLAKTVWRTFLFGTALKLMGDIIVFVNPQVLSLIIGYVNSNEPQWKGILYSIVLFVAASTRTLIQNQFSLKMIAVGIRIRSTTVSAIYKKALKISSNARKDRNVGEIVNLVAVDSHRLIELPQFLNSLWSSPLQICVAMYFLWLELGPSVLAGIGIMMLLIPINIYVGKRIKAIQMRRMKIRDRRLKQMNEILNGIKVLKLYAWEPSFEKQICKIRQDEVNLLTKSAYLKAENNFMWNYAPFVISLMTFATYVLIDENNILDANKAFVSLALFNILRAPLYQLPMEINNMIQTYVSIQRINAFMNAEELNPDNVAHETSETDTLVIDNGIFAWDDEPILKNINFRVKGETLTAVVGTVGSGKSSLLSAFLGEMNKISGRVNTIGSIAYVPQQAWIQNATLRENILFGREFNTDLYKEVIYACALKLDFDMLPGGDHTEIGEKGINLSGGQKQRVSLARAVYSNSDIYFLDDPLSAVDSHVGRHIFEKVLGPKGLLKTKTRVLVTHGVTYLPKVDKILVLKEGTVLESGTYSQLLSNKGAFAEFLSQYIRNNAENEEEMEELQDQLVGTPIEEHVKFEFVSRRSRSSYCRSENESVQAVNSLIRQKSAESAISLNGEENEDSIIVEEEKPRRRGVKLIQTEKAEIGTVKRNVYKQYVNAIGTLIIVLTVTLNASFQGFGIGTNIWLGEWADAEEMVINGTVNTSKRDMYLGIYAVLGIGQGLSTLCANILFAKGTMHAATTLHHYVLQNVMRLPMSFFDVTPSGRILARFSSDIVGIDIRLPNDLNMFIQNAVKVIGTLIVISYATPAFIGVVVPIAILYAFIQRYYVASSRQINRLQSISRSPVYSHLGESLSGAHVIRAYWQQERFILDSEKKVDANQKCVYTSSIANKWLALRLETMSNLILLFAALFAVLSHDMLPSKVGLSISYALQITTTIMRVVMSTSNVETNIVAVERLKEYGQLQQEAPWEIPEKTPAVSWPDNGSVEYKDYAVRYRRGLDLVLKDVNFKVNGGEKVGIVGRTGAGKSSLTLSLFRIIEAAQGKISIDQVNISEVGLHTLRSKLTIIPQDAVLFSGSLRMNLDPFDKYSDDELWKSLENAHLKEFVKGLPAALQHQVSEGGENLSVGQMQLICLARALLRKTKVLILDEATAAVDLETDDLIQTTIRREFRESTIRKEVKNGL